jgi:hypothetical protein
MDIEEHQRHSYLGDAVYVEWDGSHLILRTGDHRDGECENKIYLEPIILQRLNDFYATFTKGED